MVSDLETVRKHSRNVGRGKAPTVTETDTAGAGPLGAAPAGVSVVLLLWSYRPVIT